MGFVICKYNKKQTKKHRVKCKKAKIVMSAKILDFRGDLEENLRFSST